MNTSKESHMVNKPVKIKSKGRILVVEDDETSQELINLILKPLNLDISQVSNGDEAVKFIVRNGDVRLILMDIKLPDINGYEATSIIKKINPKIPRAEMITARPVKYLNIELNRLSALYNLSKESSRNSYSNGCPGANLCQIFSMLEIVAEISVGFNFANIIPDVVSSFTRNNMGCISSDMCL